MLEEALSKDQPCCYDNTADEAKVQAHELIAFFFYLIRPFALPTVVIIIPIISPIPLLLIRPFALLIVVITIPTVSPILLLLRLLRTVVVIIVDIESLSLLVFTGRETSLVFSFLPIFKDFNDH